MVDRDAFRSSLVQCDFNASGYLENEFADLDLEAFASAGDLEENLAIVLEGLVHELAIAADDIESEVTDLQRKATQANEVMCMDLGSHLDTLNGVQEAVDSIKAEFDNASKGAVKIGDRLTTSVEEKRRIMYGMELIDYINWFKAIAPHDYDARLADGLDVLKKNALPEALAEKDWGYISLMLSDLRRVLYDISEDGAQFALKNVFRLSEHVEKELLDIFVTNLGAYMDSPGDKGLKVRCNEIVKWLHLFNNGATLLKRYIFAVIEKRMPDSKFQYGITSKENIPIRERRSISVSRRSSMRGVEPKVVTGESQESPTAALDYLSQLFTTIQDVCTEQFGIIRDIFPPSIAPKITRVLIQRIYNDPAFGIQGRVDAVLQPKPPLPPLLLADYLENLSIVKEKLSALYLMLLELCSHPSFQGIGRDNWNTVHAQISKEISGHGFRGASALPDAPSSTSLVALRDPTREVEEFLEEQIMQVLSCYMASYFDKEMLHLKNTFADILRKAVDKSLNILALNNQASSSRTAHKAVITGSGSQAPRLKADKIGGIAELTETVANREFLKAILDLLGDSVHRMTNIGRDEHKLGSRLKDAYLLLLDFTVDGVMLPYVSVCTNLMQYTTRIRGRDRGRGTPSLPPLELLLVLQAVYSGAASLRSSLEGMFVKSLDLNTNMIVVCREALKSALKPLFAASKEALRVWIHCISLHIGRLLNTTQNKGDYGYSFLPGVASSGAGRIMSTLSSAKNTTTGGRTADVAQQASQCTATADKVCQALSQVVSAVHSREEDIPGLDLHEHLFNPLGQQIVGQLISHFRRLNVTEAGAEQLSKDLDEYHRIFLLFRAPEVEDMMSCLREIAVVYAAPADKVKNIIVEDLRHLDTSIVLALSRARSDYGVIQKGQDHWTRLVAAAYSLRSHRWDYELPWESTSSSSSTRWPSTLRKSSAPVSALYHELLLRGGASENRVSIRNPDRDGVDQLDGPISSYKFGENDISFGQAGAAPSADGREVGDKGNFADAVRSALSSLSQSSTHHPRPNLGPGALSNGETDITTTGRGMPQPSAPISQPMSSTMASFLSTISSSHENAFDSTGSKEDGDTGSARDAEAVSSGKSESTITSTTNRIRNALSSMGYRGDGHTESTDKSGSSSSFSTFFKR